MVSNSPRLAAFMSGACLCGCWYARGFLSLPLAPNAPPVGSYDIGGADKSPGGSSFQKASRFKSEGSGNKHHSHWIAGDYVYDSPKNATKKPPASAYFAPSLHRWRRCFICRRLPAGRSNTCECMELWISCCLSTQFQFVLLTTKQPLANPFTCTVL